MASFSLPVKFFLLAVLLLPLPARAASPVEPWSYEGYLGGLRLADVVLSLADDHPERYDSTVTIQTRGLIGFFSSWYGEILAQGEVGEDTLRPRVFQRSWVSSRRSGAIEITYDAETGLAEGFEDGTLNEDVSAELRHNTLDPLAALLAMRHHVQTAGAEGETITLPVFDGKRRLDIQAQIGAPVDVTVRRAEHRVIPVEASVHPIAGFRPRQVETWAETKITVYFTPDAQALPLQIRVFSPAGTAILTLRCELREAQCRAPNGGEAQAG